MKKIICLIVALVMSFLLLGCADGNMSAQIENLRINIEEQGDYIRSLENDQSELLDELDDLNARLESLTNALDGYIYDVINDVGEINQINEELLEELGVLKNEINLVQQEREQKQELLEEYLSVLVYEKVADRSTKDPDEDYKGCAFLIPEVTFISRFWKLGYDIDNVIIDLYCGYYSDFLWDDTDLEITVESGYAPDENDPNYMGYEYYNNEIRVTTVVDFFENEEHSFNNFDSFGVDDLKCHIQLTIPQELFVDENDGFIWVNAYDCYMWIFYKIVDGCVFLSPTAFTA